MAKCWEGLLEVGDDVLYHSLSGVVAGTLIEFMRDKSRCVIALSDGREYLALCELCTRVPKQQGERCPRCVYEGKPGELFENATLKRCYECLSDYKFELKEGEIQEPIRGMKAILG